MEIFVDWVSAFEFLSELILSNDKESFLKKIDYIDEILSQEEEYHFKKEEIDPFTFFCILGRYVPNYPSLLVDGLKKFSDDYCSFSIPDNVKSRKNFPGLQINYLKYSFSNGNPDVFDNLWDLFFEIHNYCGLEDNLKSEPKERQTCIALIDKIISSLSEDGNDRRRIEFFIASLYYAFPSHFIALNESSLWCLSSSRYSSEDIQNELSKYLTDKTSEKKNISGMALFKIIDLIKIHFFENSKINISTIPELLDYFYWKYMKRKKVWVLKVENWNIYRNFIKKRNN